VRLSGVKIPVVCIDTIPQTTLDGVGADNEFGGAMAADWFIKNGHQKCAIMLSLPHTNNPILRRRGFERQLYFGGAEMECMDCNTQPGENSTTLAYETMVNYIKRHGLTFSAIFCDTDLGGLGVLKACLDLGISVPDELSVIGFDNVPEGEYFHPAISSIDQKLSEWAVAAEEIIQARISGDKRSCFHTYIRPELILRKSCIPYGGKKQ